MTRRRFLTTLSIAGIGSVLGVEGLVLGPHRLTITRHHVRSPGAASGPRLRIAQLTDLHLRGLGGYQERIAAEVNALSADVVVLTGDSIDQQKRLSALGTFLGWLESPYKYAILGNWERWIFREDIRSLETVYTAHDTRLLVNESVEHEHRGRSLLITGLDDYVGGEADYQSAIRDHAAPANHLLLQHCPEFRDHLDPATRNPDLMLAGHTHGGQVQVLGFAPVRPRGSGRYVQGWYRDREPHLYVSPGLGTVVIPVRLGAPPEIAVFDWTVA
jgi:predicted MPP superfamily phosphohydrolase